MTLNGTSTVTTTQTFLRVYRVYCLTAGSGTTNAGTITVRHSTTTANVFSVMPVGFGQSQLALYTIPAGYTGYLRRYSASMLGNASNSAELVLWARGFGAAVRLRRPFTIATSSDTQRALYGGEVFEEKTDLVMRVLSVGSANADVTASFGLLLVAN